MASSTPSLNFLPFLMSGMFWDLSLECEDVLFQVHGIIACSHSRVIREAVFKAVQNKWEVSLNDSWREPAILSQAILFMYTNDYDHSEWPDFYARLTNCERRPFSSVFDHLEVDVQVYQCAKFLEIEPLKALAAKKFLDEVPKQCHDARFATVLKSMYRTVFVTDRQLRLATQELFLTSLLDQTVHEEVQAVIEQFKPDFSYVFATLMEEVEAEENDQVAQNTFETTLAFRPRGG